MIIQRLEVPSNEDRSGKRPVRNATKTHKTEMYISYSIFLLWSTWFACGSPDSIHGTLHGLDIADPNPNPNPKLQARNHRQNYCVSLPSSDTQMAFGMSDSEKLEALPRNE